MGELLEHQANRRDYIEERRTLSDQQLLAAARKGDKEAFQMIVQKYENQVAATIIGMLGYGPESEDVGQETFIRFYKAMKQFRGDAAIGTYLTRIAINLSLNEIKKRKRRSRLFKTSSENTIDQHPDSHNRGEKAEAAKIVHWGLSRLEPKFRSVIVLRLIDGFSCQETARILNLPEGTVFSRLARGQQKLRDILAPITNESPKNSKGDDHE